MPLETVKFQLPSQNQLEQEALDGLKRQDLPMWRRLSPAARQEYARKQAKYLVETFEAYKQTCPAPEALYRARLQVLCGVYGD